MLRTLQWSVAALALAATTTLATEVTVKNDSFTSGGSAQIVGDFVPGEEAGARLTSPCNGTIVAVQIGWLSDPPGAAATLERFIHIYDYDSESWPVPGAEIETLEAPQLTPGFINEFRFLDENNTIPLNVPVAAGQDFIVTLEFDNATNILAGTPSVFRDLNGCQSTRNVLLAIPGGWRDFCIFLSGDLVIRAVIDCTDPEGACCLPDATCDELTPGECTAAGGAYQGDFTECADVQCPDPVGACCFPATGGCLVRTITQCQGAGGIFQGGGTNCVDLVCFPMGACCLPDGTCVPDQSPGDCQTAGGVFQGDGSDCTSGCPDPQGACCFASGFCLFETESDCLVAGGAWQGFGTDCLDNSGSGTADDCEAGCAGDLDGSGGVDFDDLLILLGNFGCAGGSCAGDIDGNGATDFDDLLILLGVFGSSC